MGQYLQIQMRLASATSSSSSLLRPAREAQPREQAWEQLVSPSQEELSSTIGRQLMETLPCTTKELPSTPALATQVPLVPTITTRTSTARTLAPPPEPMTLTNVSSSATTGTECQCTACARTLMEWK